MKNSKKASEKFVKWVNDNFKPTNEKYPVAIQNDDEFILSAECSAIYPEDQNFKLPVADYYGEFRGGYPWIHPEIEKKATKMGLILEWQNPGCVGIYSA